MPNDGLINQRTTKPPGKRGTQDPQIYQGFFIAGPKMKGKPMGFHTLGSPLFTKP